MALLGPAADDPTRVSSPSVRVLQRHDPRPPREPTRRLSRGSRRAIGDAGGLARRDRPRPRRAAARRCATSPSSAGDARAHRADRRGRPRRSTGVEVEHVSDRTFLLHLGGKLEVEPKAPLKTRDDLSMAYTPGVARSAARSPTSPSKVWNLTIKQNAVAVVTDGTAVLGLGDIGPEAALPVMEGKAMLFKEFGGVDALPICLATTDADEIVAAVKAIAPVFGGINLEDISAPRCFEIEARLREDARHPGLPRRPARDGDRRPRGAPERAARRRQAARGRAGRDRPASARPASR